MKELSDILRSWRRCREAGVDAAVATVVRVRGSSYRRAGARMLISSDGQFTGGVSGGCLERDVVVRAGAVMNAGKPVLVRYDTTLDVEAGTGYSLGCGGAIDVLIEPLQGVDALQLLDWLEASQSRRMALVTAVSRQHPLMPLGSRRVLFEADQQADRDAHWKADWEAERGSGMSAELAKEARACLMSNRSKFLTLSTEHGPLDLFVEVLNPPLHLLMFGAGNDAMPVAAFAQALGWRVTVVDLRSGPVDLGRQWDVHRVIRCDVKDVRDRVTVEASMAAVVMTHNFSHDRQVVEWLSSQSLRYLGLLGPRHRTDALLEGLSVAGLRSPVGLDLGADQPEEVALAIVAEITAVLHGRTGVSLSAREGPIHPCSPTGGTSR
jgi:xanthine/CO dehydrogenase XdhC/CoxF family maturation factor